MIKRILPKTNFLSMLIVLALLTTIANVQDPTLTIDAIESNRSMVTIHYTTADSNGDNLVTTNWQYSIDGGLSWLDIDAKAISQNNPKPPGSATILWDTMIGTNNLASEHYPSIRFQMQVTGGGLKRTRATMPTARASFAVAVVNEKIYTIGGIGGKVGENHLHTVEVYDTATDRW